jgi:hypothetical protein
MSTLSIWRCEHDCDRRECHYCFTKNELDRLVEGHFKQYYAFENSPRPDTKRKGPDNNRDELDGSHFYDADTESDRDKSDRNNKYNKYESHHHHHKHHKHHRGGCLPIFSDTVVDVPSINAFDTKPDSVQSVPGLLSSDQRDSATTNYSLSNIAEPKSEPKSIETASNNNLHRNDTATHSDAIDYESKCDIA